MRKLVAGLFLSLTTCGGFFAELYAQSPDNEWRFYGGDPGGARFSPLKQINRKNVHQLQRAWSYHTGELNLVSQHNANTGFAATPLVVDGVLYISTHSSRVIALDAETGVELWKYDAQAGKTGAARQFQPNRGVSYWEGLSADGQFKDRRIVFGTADGRLIALDAGSGKPISGFGNSGSINLREGVWPQAFFLSPNSQYAVTAPPVIYKDLVITGSRVSEGFPQGSAKEPSGGPGKGPSGDVRAFDVRTGQLVWRFHTVPRPGEIGHETWEGDSWKDRTGVNVWSIMSVDLERGMVFLPIGSPAYDFYGGNRKGQNLFGNSLVALDANTGKMIWYYQMVHHDLWDYDLPAQPSLIVVKHSGRTIPAVAQVTKMGFVFILDRLTGSPLFPIEERPVPKSEVPGEAASPTQPVPLKPAPLARLTMTADEISTVTPESNRYCTDLYKRLQHQGIFTPTGLQRTLMFPGYYGGGNWSGASFDPLTSLLYVNVNSMGAVGRMVTQDASDTSSDPSKHSSLVSPVYKRWGESSPQGYGWFRDQNKWPCQQPPWGTLNAINVNTGDIVWKVPLGVVDELVARGLPPTGTQSLGGTIVTAGGLVFIAGTTDKRFRAFDAQTGKELWQGRLEASGHATPMTFQGRTTGKQYVVIAAGGGGYLRDLSPTVSDTLIAFALPK